MEFKSLNIIKPIIDALDKQGYKNPTPIQERTIPLLLENKDVILKKIIEIDRICQ